MDFSPLFQAQPFKASEIKTALNIALTDIDESFLKGQITTEAALQSRSSLLNTVLVEAWQYFGLQQDNVSLMSLGGLSRAELFPKSDTDLFILTQNPSPKLHYEIETFVQFCWDIGISPGFSVRTLEQCQDHLDDLSIYTNLLTAKWLAGSKTLVVALQALIFNPTEENSAPLSFLKNKLLERQENHKKFNNTEYQLEPNLKESPGGLRDIHILEWLCHRYFENKGHDTSAFNLLEKNHLLTPNEKVALERAHVFLCRHRYLLHLLTPQNSDRLFFDHQSTLVTHLHQARANNASVSLFMQQCFAHLKTVQNIFEVVILGFLEYAQQKKAFHLPQLFSPELTPITDIKMLYPVLMAIACQEEDTQDTAKGIFPPGFDWLTQHRLLSYPESLQSKLVEISAPLHREFFLDCLTAPNGIAAITLLHRYDLLYIFIPDFAYITGQVQLDLYHTYPVDKHILSVLGNLYLFRKKNLPTQFLLCHQRLEELDAPHICLLAALFHDIGKGHAEDHSKLGEALSRAYGQQLGLSEEDVTEISWLVENHLYMSYVAQKQDIQDIQVIEEFTQKVGGLTRLNRLYVLTVADIYGTNPSLWNGWRESLLRDLYQLSKNYLLNAIPPAQAPHINLNEQIAADIGSDISSYQNLEQWYQSILKKAQDSDVTEHCPIIDIHPHHSGMGTDIYIFTHNRPHLFSYLATTFSRMGLNIVEARFVTQKDFCLNTFVVLETSGVPILAPSRIIEIKQVLHALLSPLIHQNTPIHLPPFAHRLTKRVKFHQNTVKVEFLNMKSPYTVVQASSPDFPGLLSRIGQAFIEMDVFVHNAKIITLGKRVEDTFYVSMQNTFLALDNEQCKKLKKLILQHLTQSPTSKPS